MGFFMGLHWQFAWACMGFLPRFALATRMGMHGLLHGLALAIYMVLHWPPAWACMGFGMGLHWSSSWACIGHLHGLAWDFYMDFN